VPIERPPSQYRQLADLLRERILRGDYPPGSTFPSEPELAAEHSLSRPTVNRALLVLRGEGLIRVERGRGTTVRSVPAIPRHATTRYARENRERHGARGAFDTEITRLGFEPRSDLVAVGPTRPPEDVANALRLEADKEALIRKRHMFAGDTPVQLASSYVPWSIAEGTQLEQTDTGPGGTYSRLAELGHEPTRFTEVIALRPPSSEEADFLRLADEQHVLVIFHTAWTAEERPVEVTIHVLPPHQWELHYDWPAEPPVHRDDDCRL
jgi:GntR family transcriptional regulator